MTGSPFSGLFMPPVLRTSLRCTFERASAAATSVGGIPLSGNNVQDPTLSAGTEQPPGFTALATLYSRYRVIASHVEIRAVMAQSAITGAMNASGQIAIYPANSSGTPTDMESAISQALAKFRQITANTPQVIKHTMSTVKITGQRTLAGSDRLQSLVSGAPSEEWYWVIVFASDAAYTDVRLDFHIQITYDVEFYDRPVINQAFESWKHMKNAYLARCREIKADIVAEEKRRAEAKARVEDAILGKLSVESKESKQSEQPKPLCVSEDEEDYPLEVLKSKAKEAQRKLALAENDLKLETASRKGK